MNLRGVLILADNYIEAIWLSPISREWNYFDFSSDWNTIDSLSMTWSDFERGAYDIQRPKEWDFLDISQNNWNTIDSLLLTWNEFERGGYNG